MLIATHTYLALVEKSAKKLATLDLFLEMSLTDIEEFVTLLSHYSVIT